MVQVMDMLEFYEKHWKVKTPDGSMSSPPPLSDDQKELLKAFSEGKEVFVFGHFRGGRRMMAIAEKFETSKHEKNI